jgi:PKD repeat protein
MRRQTNLARAAGILASVAVLGFQLGAAGPAGAVVARTDAGHPVSYQPTVTEAAVARSLAPLGTSPAASSQAGAYKECSSQAACLSYHGGPVMRTATLTPIFWNPKGLGLSYPSGYTAEIEQFFTDLAADSGRETNFFSLLPQYYDTIGGGVHHIGYSVTAGTPLTDTDSLPAGAANECETPFEGSGRPCVQDNGVRAELEGLVKNDALATGVGHEYLVFFPPGIDSCFDGGGKEDFECSGTGYCGYHGTLSATVEKEVEYANEPDNADPEYGGGCTAKESLKAGAKTLNTASHEISESVTDPQVEEPGLSWYDFNTRSTLVGTIQYGEIGDMCGWEFQQGDPPLGLYTGETSLPVAFESDQTINGHAYLLQTEWDNAHSTCSVSERTSATKASFTQSTAGPVQTGVHVSVNGTGSFAPVPIESYEWEWGDGTITTGSSPTAEHSYVSTEGENVKTFTITLTVTDKNGNQKSTAHTVKVEDRPPTATFTPPAGATAGAGAQFDGSSSSDPDGTIAAYEWSFGDGTAATGPSPAHAYVSPGEYTVKLTVTDDAGNTAEVSHPVTVALAPEPKTEPEPEPAKTSGTSTGEPSKESAPKGEPGNGGAPSNVVRLTGSKQNKKKGTISLTVTVPGAGVLSVREASAAHSTLVTPLAGALVAPAPYPVALIATVKGKAKPKSPFVKSQSIAVGAAGTVTIQVLPNAAGSALLKSRHKLALKILIAFTPTGGTQGTLVQPVTLVLSATKKHK